MSDDIQDDTNQDDTDQAQPDPAASTPAHRLLVGAGIAAAVAIIATLAVVGARQTDSTAALADPVPDDTHPPATTPLIIEAPGTTTTTVPGATTTTLKPRRIPTGPRGPLTNAPVDYKGYERRPALVVKIDNYDPYARPQAGITLADIVYEERVEGGITRFAAVFHGADSDEIGPIRSARSTDLGITSMLQTPLFAYSGANGFFEGRIAGADLVNISASKRSSAYYRHGYRPSPHNLFTSTQALYRSRGVKAPTPLWRFRGDTEQPGPGAKRVSAASLSFGAGIPVTWTWNAQENGWARTQNGSPHKDSDGYQVMPQNVIIQYVPYVSSGVNDGNGNPIPEAQLTGTGTGVLLTGGSAISLNWARFVPEAPTTYVGPDGKEVRLAPGRTWVELVPTGQTARLYG